MLQMQFSIWKLSHKADKLYLEEEKQESTLNEDKWYYGHAKIWDAVLKAHKIKMQSFAN